MANTVSKDTANKVIATNISCIKTLLEKALVAAVDADQAADKNERNQAIGCLLDLDAILANTKALYDATIFMHRNA